MLVLKIAWRNLFRHKGKSLVIGIILILGALLMTGGAAVIEGANRGIQENLVERFIGHVVAVSDDEEKENVFFTPMMKSVKIITDYPKVKEFLASQDCVSEFLPMCRGMATILNEQGTPQMGLLFGVSFDDYRKMFRDNFILVEGKLLSNTDRGVIISSKTREQYYKMEGFWVKPEGETLNEANLTEDAKKYIKTLDVRDNLVFMGLGEENFGRDIRVPIKGIFKYKVLNDMWYFISFMDIESFRECFGYFSAEDTSVSLSKEQEKLLAMDTGDDFFSDDTFIQDTKTLDLSYDLESLKEEQKTEQKPVDVDAGAYHLISIKLKSGVTIADGISRLNKAFRDAGLGLHVTSWKKAAGQVADISTILQLALVIFVVIIYVVATIVIINTLSMAACERTTEIGTMRAVGAQKSFTGSMFFWETALLSFAAGAIGVIIGIIAVGIVSLFKISAGGNEVLSLLFGGDYLRPVLNVNVFFILLLLLAIVTGAAMIYPVMIARKISALDAVSRD